MARILRARYFSDGDILKATLRRKASYAWKSILHGRDLLIKGLKYIIGDGSHVEMWTDKWIPDHPPRSPRPIGDAQHGMKVQEFIAATTRQWDEQKLRQYVVAEDVVKILALKISPTAQTDLLGWHYIEDGLYTVRSGYWLGSHLPDNNMLIYQLMVTWSLSNRYGKLRLQ